MWLFTPLGFFSIVTMGGKPQTMMIRSRLREHLEAIQSMEGCPASIADAPILKQPHSDYLWRIIASKEDSVQLITMLGDRIDYGNFKTAASMLPLETERNGKPFGAEEKQMRYANKVDYLDCLHNVWSEMYSLQHKGSDRMDVIRL